MNEIAHTASLWIFLTNREGWGRKAGEVAGKKLHDYIAARPDVGVFRVSLLGVKRLDAAFASAAVVSVIGKYRIARPICLVDGRDEDITDNVASAARELNVPVTVWNAAGVQVLGPPTTRSARHALDFALSRPEVRAAEYANTAGISISNASTRFNKLWTLGCLVRGESTAPSGGVEFIYRAIG